MLVLSVTISHKYKRWHMYNSLINDSSYKRLCVVPQRIDMIETSALKGNFYSIGYATFTLSTTNSAPLVRSSSSIILIEGFGDDINIGFYPPYDATQSDDDELSQIIPKFLNIKEPYSSLAFYERVEETIPLGFVSRLFTAESKFCENLILLALKNSITLFGYSGVYIFENKSTRFLVLLGTPTYSNHAFVIAENANGSQTMNMIFSSTNGNSFLQNIISFLFSFNFTVENLNDENEIISLIENSDVIFEEENVDESQPW